MVWLGLEPRMEGVDKSTELWQHPLKMAKLSLLTHKVWDENAVF